MDSRDPYLTQSDDPLGDLARLVGQPDPFVASNSLHHGAGFGEADGTDDITDDAFFSELESELAISMADGAEIVEDDFVQDDDLGIDTSYIEDDLEADGEGPTAFGGSAPGFASAAAPHERRSSKVVPIAASLLVLAGLGVAGVYGYGAMTGTDSGEVPLITAGAGPVKRTVEGPTGAQIPHQNKLVYERVTGQEPEIEQATLLPQPDEVREMPEADGPIQPRKVRTVTVRPDGTIVRDDGVAITQPVSAPADQPISTQQVARAVPVRVISTPGSDATPGSEAAERPVSEAEATALANFGNADAQIGSVEDGDQIAALTEVPIVEAVEIDTLAVSAEATEAETAPNATITVLPMPKPAGLEAPAAAPQPTVAAAPAEPAPAAPTPAAASASGWMVQLTSQRSEAQAKQAFDSLKGRFSNVLGTAQPDIARADLGDRGVFYRVRVVADSRGDADQLCGSLKSAGGDCFVQYVN